MSDKKHTPGPWKAQLSPRPLDSDDWCIGSDGQLDNVAVCSERDAALIAAAPEMLSVLDRIISETKGNGLLTISYETFDALKEVVAKAQG